MANGLRTAALLLFLWMTTAVAHAPLARAGILGQDMPVLVQASRIAQSWDAEDGSSSNAPAPPAIMDEPALEPALTRVSLALSNRLWTKGGTWTFAAVRILRGENLAILLVAAGLAGLCTRRLLLPWTGSDAAGAAGWASAFLIAAHPLCVPAVAQPGSRGDLLAFLFGALSAVLFLRARQDRQVAPMIVSALAAMMAGFCSRLSLLIPILLATLEFTSARRYRTLHVRVRTAATTLVVFAGLVAVDRLVTAFVRASTSTHHAGPGLGQEMWAWTSLASLDSAASTWAVCIEKLGLAFLPVPPGESGGLAFLASGLLVLCALHPALRAARSAPRLWGWILVIWCAALAVALLSEAGVRVQVEDFSRAAILLPVAVLIAVGLAVASTALSGLRRQILPIAIAIGFALLGRRTGNAWIEASGVLMNLQQDLRALRELYGGDTRFLVIDPPERVHGLAVVGDALPLFFEPALSIHRPDRGDLATEPEPLRERPARAPAGQAGPAGWVRGLSAPAFFALSREPEFGMLRRHALAVVFPTHLLSSGAPTPLARSSILIAPPEPSTGPFFWRAQGRSPSLLDVDPLARRALRADVLPETSTAEAPRLGWRAREAQAEKGSLDGVWLESETGPVAMFDMSRSFAWLCGQRIARLSIERGPSQIVSVEVLEDVPRVSFDPLPESDADDWRMHLPLALDPRAVRGEVRCVVGLLDLSGLSGYRYAEFPAGARSGDEVTFVGAGAWERDSLRRGGGPIAWSLEYRVGGTAVLRAAGRRKL